VRYQLMGLAVLLAGCGGSTDPDRTPTPNTPADVIVAPPGEVRLALGQSLRLSNPDVKIRFAAVSDDSRCPINVVCVWAGDARLAFEASGSVQRHFELHLPTEQIGPRSIVLGSYQIEVVLLEPAPTAGQPTRPEDYRVTLSIH
jgi:hypothetical protein